MRVLVMAGTQDAVNIIKILSQKGETSFNNINNSNNQQNICDPYINESDKGDPDICNPDNIWILATTTTDYGAQLAKNAGAHEVISQALNRDELVGVINDKEVEVLIDATHPFAAEATRTAIYAAEKTLTPYIRFERPYLDLEKSHLIHLVGSFDEAGEVAHQLSQKQHKHGSGMVLHLAGVSTLKPVLKQVPDEKLYARVLPTIQSLEKCRELGLPGDHILAMQGVFSKEFNKSLMKEYNISVIITKESGETGGVPSKIDAAQELNVDIVLVTRPRIAELDQKIVVSSFHDLKKELDDLFK